MRAYVIDAFGDTPSLREVPVPDPGPGEVQIRVRAAGVNPLDFKTAGGELAGSGAEFSFPLTLGFDVAGTVTAAGEGADFTVGDEVFGLVWPRSFAHGSFAEYMTAPRQAALALRPEGLDPVAAAALPMTGGTAQSVVDWLGLTEGEKLLVVGATGGVGSYALQMAADRGAHVIAVAAAADHEYARSLGAAEAIDHRTTDVADAVRAAHPDGIDAVVDLADDAETVSTRIAPLLRDGGRLLSTVFATDPDALAARGVRAVNFAYRATGEDMARLATAVTAGGLRVAETRDYPLASIDEARTALLHGHVRGKLVVTT
ncbi:MULTISPECIES: NADP-dependent oxidoreductase [unclassified Streptomyces]|uniref:NADP-dependent oxidoreductase n=1 Tax=unclassified Streptomyces TaxID=2593676 RepID=UPI0004BD8953|nr:MULTISPECIES: NADP-dependent oxidoreductase [unclassified Streptomyces]